MSTTDTSLLDWKILLQTLKNNENTNTTTIDDILKPLYDVINSSNNAKEHVRALRCALILSTHKKCKDDTTVPASSDDMATLQVRIKTCRSLIQFLTTKDVESSSSSSNEQNDVAINRGARICTLASKVLCNLCTHEPHIISQLNLPLTQQYDIVEGDVSFLGMLLQNSGNRECMAAVLATLHNYCAFLQKSRANLDFLQSIASDSIFMSNLMRYLLPSTCIQKTGEENDETPNSATATEDDACTEWIVLLIQRLLYFEMSIHENENNNDNSEFGSSIQEDEGPDDDFASPVTMLEHMYNSCGAALQQNLHAKCTLEQVVLLYTVHSILEEIYDDSMGNGVVFSFSELLCMMLYLSQQLEYMCSARDNVSSDDEQFAGERDSQNAAIGVMMDIISSMLLLVDNGKYSIIRPSSRVNADSTDDDSNSMQRKDIFQNKHQVRERILQRTNIFSSSIHLLDRIVQSYSTNKSASLSPKHSHSQNNDGLLRSTLRLITNILHESFTAQEMLRDIKFEAGEKCGVHVILSCTGLDMKKGNSAKFVREWAVVAIRNMLDGNVKNRELVEKLNVTERIKANKRDAAFNHRGASL